MTALRLKWMQGKRFPTACEVLDGVSDFASSDNLSGHEEEDGFESADSEEVEADLEIRDQDPPKSSFQEALEQHHAKTHAYPVEQSQLTPQQVYEQKNENIIDQAREYQQELFERAKDENILAVLGTGMGKTLIAAMLIRHMLEQDLFSIAQDNKPKTVFFLANR
jgi:type I site-specific restriction endonuclease